MWSHQVATYSHQQLLTRLISASRHTFRVFSNWDIILVIMPSEAMKERRDSTWVTPLRSMCHLGIFQLPLLMLLSRLAVMIEDAMDLPMSNTAARLDLEMALSAYTCRCNRFSRLSSIHSLHHQQANMLCM